MNNKVYRVILIWCHFLFSHMYQKVERMIAFMDKEGEERRKEMFEKADEEYNIQIGYMLRTERAKLSNWYKKKEDAVVMSRKV